MLQYNSGKQVTSPARHKERRMKCKEEGSQKKSAERDNKYSNGNGNGNTGVQADYCQLMHSRASARIQTRHLYYVIIVDISEAARLSNLAPTSHTSELWWKLRT